MVPVRGRPDARPGQPESVNAGPCQTGGNVPADPVWTKG
jgi:hypothetical protein